MVAAATLALVGLLAGYIPARRAAAVEPVMASAGTSKRAQGAGQRSADQQIRVRVAAWFLNFELTLVRCGPWGFCRVLPCVSRQRRGRRRLRRRPGIPLDVADAPRGGDLRPALSTSRSRPRRRWPSPSPAPTAITFRPAQRHSAARHRLRDQPRAREDGAGQRRDAAFEYSTATSSCPARRSRPARNVVDDRLHGRRRVAQPQRRLPLRAVRAGARAAGDPGVRSAESEGAVDADPDLPVGVEGGEQRAPRPSGAVSGVSDPNGRAVGRGP